jgi:hypothetical protein
VVIALFVAVLGVMFGKTGEHNRLTRISYLFITLAVLSAAYGGFDIWRKAKGKAASDRATASEMQAVRTARDKAETQYAQTRRVLELNSFELNRPFTYGIFFIDFGMTPDGEGITPPGYTGPFPTLGRAGMQGEVKLTIDGVFDYLFHITSGPAGVITVRREGGDTQVFDPKQPYCYATLTGSCQDSGTVPTNGNWWIDYIVPNYTHGVMLDSSVPLNKFASRAMEAETYGRMTFRIPGLMPQEYEQVIKGLADLHPDLKLYTPMHAKPTEDCENSNIHLPLSLKVSPRSSLKEIIVDFVPGNARFDTVECEDSPV